MSEKKLAGADNLEITTESAQAIVNDIGEIVKQNINMMNRDGVIIASTDLSRIGHLHEGARKVLDDLLGELYTTPECATDTARVGLNLPIIYDGGFVGVIGITGEYELVKPFGQIVKKMVEILIRENWAQDQLRLQAGAVNRFLEDWVLGDGLLHPDALAERGFQLGIDITLPRRVMVVGVRTADTFLATSDGQELLERMEKDIAACAKPGLSCILLRNAGRQILLLNRCGERKLMELADRLFQMGQDRYQVTFAMGIDGNAEDVHAAYIQASRAWRSARFSSFHIRSYDQITLELFTGDIPGHVKADYIHKVFRNCSFEDIRQWMEVLEVYFAVEGSVSAAADTLFIHKNTMTYKLKKLYELTGYDVRLTSNTTVFYMALLFFQDVRTELEHDGR